MVPCEEFFIFRICLLLCRYFVIAWERCMGCVPCLLSYFDVSYVVLTATPCLTLGEARALARVSLF